MKVTPLRIVIAALLAGSLGVVASVLVNGPGPLAGTELGQRVLNHAASASAPTAPPGIRVPGRGDAVEAFAISDLEGQPVHLPSDFSGRPLLVNIWASWCGPCIEEMPELDRFASEQGANGTQVLGIALDDADAVRDFLQRIPVSYAIALDTPGAADAGVRVGNPRGVLPYTALISADGRVLKQKIGPFQHGEIDTWVTD